MTVSIIESTTTIEPLVSDWYTGGGWLDKPASVADLDRRLEECGLFQVLREVDGYYVQPRYLSEEKQPRIDRLLIPGKRLADAGWRYGVIGVECKKSGKKIGAALAQCQDYSRAIFTTARAGVSVQCEWIFLWPLKDFAGPTASLMTQNRIGGAYGDAWSLLTLKLACGSVLSVSTVGQFRIGNVRAGMKVGSR